MFQLRRSKADKLFSEFIRLRDGYSCQRCFKTFRGLSPYLHAAHFYGRRGKSTRFDPDNVISLCGTIGFPGGCHGYFADHPHEFREFMFKRLGEQKFDALVFRAHTPVKIDEEALVIGLKMALEEMKKARSDKNQLRSSF